MSSARIRWLTPAARVREIHGRMSSAIVIMLSGQPCGIEANLLYGLPVAPAMLLCARTCSWYPLWASRTPCGTSRGDPVGQSSLGLLEAPLDVDAPPEGSVGDMAVV